MKQQKGFTIIELMFSTVIFSIILLLSLAALVQIGKLYYKGVTTSQTQQVARNVLDSMSQSIQLSADNVNFPLGPTGPDIGALSLASGVFCIGDTRYTYAIDRQLTEGTPDASKKEKKHVLWADKLTNCAGMSGIPAADLDSDTPSPAANKGRELLGAHMRILKLKVFKPVAAINSVWQIDLTIGYGDEDLFILDNPTTPTRKYCQTAQAGTQFCATSELSTIVNRRL